tara:strand:+ start:160 stop:348 length:189 start_codon:yes stop_codon:yes gene_type:complete
MSKAKRYKKMITILMSKKFQDNFIEYCKKKKKASSEHAGWGTHLKRRSRVFKEGQDKMKAIK